ncbi:MAG: ribonuclease III domain-containing protein [Candidatus Gastranaerophilales bacterium]|nr:ribonuclease III domain-containing protein [Candidatus Gastranaerophilales bacterium]
MTNSSYKNNIKNLAHLGDSVYEVFVREYTISLTQNLKTLHKLTVSFVNAQFQADILEQIESYLSQEELEIVRRGRNLSLGVSKKVNQQAHRLATAFEALIGYLYLNDKQRLYRLYELILPILEKNNV